LSRACGELNRIGSNINQLARAANMGGQLAGGELAAAMAELRQAIGLVRASMGFAP
jgi:autotransporter translocation and assembly factor TamB